MLQDVLVIASATLVLVAVLVALAAALTIRSLRRRNRVVPTVPAVVPLAWLWSPGRPARLHRRLQAVVAVSHQSVDAASRHRLEPLADLVADVEEHAVVIDRRLLIAAKAPLAVRRRLLAELRDEVRDAEGVAYRIARTANAWADAGIEKPPLHRIHERLDVLEEAVADLDRVDSAERILRG